MTGDFDIRRIEVIDDERADLFRSMTPGQRVRMGLSMHPAAVSQMEAKVRCEHPVWDDAKVQFEVLQRFAHSAAKTIG